MRKTICFFLTLLTLSSCNKEEKAYELAEKFIKEQLLPCFHDAEIKMPDCIKSWTNISFVKGKEEKDKLYSLCDLSGDDVRLHYAITIPKDKERAEENLSTIKKVERSSYNAITEANEKEGFYFVQVPVKFDEDGYTVFNIVVSKDLKVLNKPIDLLSED